MDEKQQEKRKSHKLLMVALTPLCQVSQPPPTDTSPYSTSPHMNTNCTYTQEPLPSSREKHLIVMFNNRSEYMRREIKSLKSLVRVNTSNYEEVPTQVKYALTPRKTFNRPYECSEIGVSTMGREIEIEDLPETVSFRTIHREIIK